MENKDSLIGKVILNYRITALLGSGGMGSVYLGENKFIKQQKVAIKVINREMVNGFTMQRLHEEAEYLASMHHPNIVGFINYHIDEEGNVFLIMEYAEGITLEDYIAKKTGLIVEDRLFPLFGPILDAIGYAHSQKRPIIHQDIKPANVIISEDGTPKVLDFGIATIWEGGTDKSSEGAPGTQATGSGNKKEHFIMGTPAYMSPEQVKGEEVGIPSDIYALGVMLFQMLTGKMAYDTTTISISELNDKILHEPLPRLKSYYKPISEGMQKIVDKATAKRPEDRFQSCEEFKKVLYRTLYPWKMPFWMKAACAAAACAVLGGGIYVWDYNRTKVYYYKDYVEQWGIPQGIHKLSKAERANRMSSYKFVYQKRKLRQMSYVNSRGKLITHNTTDNVERPTDITFFYGTNDSIDYAKIYNQSGKLIYVKGYSKDLKTVTFFRDEGRSIEKAAAGSTVTTFTSSFANEDDGKSQITKNLIHYDENGFVTKIEYARNMSILAHDKEGIYGKQFKLDEKGRVVEEIFIGFDGNPKASASGMAIRTREYNDQDDAVKFTYLSADRKPSGEKNLKIPVCRDIVDEWGNSIRQQYEDMDGNLILRADYNVAAIEYTIEHGMRTSQAMIGADGKRCYDKASGVSLSRYEYDDNGYIKSVRHFDTTGRPMADISGTYGMNIENDEKGNSIYIAYLDDEGNLLPCSEGYAVARSKFDNYGNTLEFSCYNEKDSLITPDVGVAITEARYDDFGNRVFIKNYDNLRQPMKNANDIICFRMDYSRSGNLEKVSYFEADEKTLALNNEGIAGWESYFDANGNETKRIFIGTDSRPTLLAGDNYAGWCAEYDSIGNTADVTYFDTSGNPCVIADGYAGWRCTRDKRGNILTLTHYGLDKELAEGRLYTTYKYDSNDNETEVAFFGRDKKPDTNGYGIHKIVRQFNNMNLMTEERYFGKENTPTVGSEGYSTVRYKYNEKGWNTEAAFYGIDGNLTEKKGERYAIHRDEFNINGRKVRRLFYNTSDRLCDPAVHAPEEIYQYDNWGNVNYTAYSDGDGNLIISPLQGWAIERAVYDIGGRLLENTYYNEKDEPMLVNQVFRLAYEYDKRGNQVALRCFGLDFEPTDCAAGFQRVAIEYTKDGVRKERKYFANSGELLKTEYWDGRNWTDRAPKPVPAPVLPALKKQADEINALLPINMGEEYKNLSFTAFMITDAHSYTLHFKTPKSKYEMSRSELSEYALLAKQYLRTLRSQGYISDGISVSCVLYDSKGRRLRTIK